MNHSSNKSFRPKSSLLGKLYSSRAFFSENTKHKGDILESYGKRNKSIINDILNVGRQEFLKYKGALQSSNSEHKELFESSKKIGRRRSTQLKVKRSIKSLTSNKKTIIIPIAKQTNIRLVTKDNKESIKEEEIAKMQQSKLLNTYISITQTNNRM